MSQVALEIFKLLAMDAIPVAFVFGMGNLLIVSFLRVAFGGRMEIKA